MYSIAREDTKHTMTADQVKHLLKLEPHPREGGFYIRTYESNEFLDASVFAEKRYSRQRHTSTAIYYLLEPGTFSEMHRLRSDEIFHFYAGDAVEMLQLYADGTGASIRIGNQLEKGERPQVLVPRGIWQGSRLVEGGNWALLGCTVSPGFDFDDYEAGDRTLLCSQWPQYVSDIEALTHRAKRAV